MDKLEQELRQIRSKRRSVQQRDTFGRFIVEDRNAPRREQLNLRLNATEKDTIKRVAVMSGKTITNMVIDAVRYYATLMD